MMRRYFLFAFLSTAALLAGCAAMPAANGPVVVTAKPEPAAAQTAAAGQLSRHLMYDLLVGEVAGQRGQLGVAVKYYLKAAQTSSDPQIAARATRIAAFAQDESSALIAARRWAQLDPGNPEARQALAVLYLRAGDTQASLKQFEWLVASTPGAHGAGFLSVAELLAGEPKKTAALNMMKQLVDQHRNDPYARFAYSRLALAAGKPALARTEIEDVLKRKPHWTEAQILYASILTQQGRGEKALAYLRAAVRAKPKDRALRLSYAQQLIQLKHLEQARAQFRVLARREPGNPNVLLALSLLSLETKHYTDARATLLRLVKTGYRVSEAYYYLGRIEEAEKHDAKAAEWYSRVDHGEHLIDAQIRIAALQAKQGHLDAARQRLRNLRARFPSIAASLYVAEGEILREGGRDQDAMTLYNRALKKLPGNVDLLYARALIADKLNQIALAERDLSEIIKREPDNAYALNALGYTLADRTTRYQEALGYITRALKLRPDDPAIIDSMGWVQYRLGRYQDSLKYLRRAYDLSHDPEVAAHLVQVLWVAGNHKGARTLWREALKRHPHSKALREAAKRFGQ